MPLDSCNVAVDGSQRELTVHGSALFPIACYHDDLGVDQVPWHWHEELEVVLVEAGSCTVSAGKETFLVREGEGFFVNTGVLHGCWDREGSHCRFHSLVFHPRLVGGGLDSVFHQRYMGPVLENQALTCLHLTPEIPWQKQALDCVERAWQSCVREVPAYELEVRNALSSLTALLCLHVGRDSSGLREDREDQRLKRMLAYLQAHCAGEIRLGDIARAASVSESECLRCFRGIIGITPIQYLRQYRIQKAAGMLLSTRDPVSDIAAACGFSDMSYFAKTFRELKGCTPSDYRRKG